MDLIPPEPEYPPEDYIKFWNNELIKLVSSRKEFFKIKDYLMKENWSRESCFKVIDFLSNIQISDEDNQIFLFLLEKCLFHCI